MQRIGIGIISALWFAAATPALGNANSAPCDCPCAESRLEDCTCEFWTIHFFKADGTRWGMGTYRSLEELRRDVAKSQRYERKNGNSGEFDHQRPGKPCCVPHGRCRQPAASGLDFALDRVERKTARRLYEHALEQLGDSAYSVWNGWLNRGAPGTAVPSSPVYTIVRDLVTFQERVEALERKLNVTEEVTEELEQELAQLVNELNAAGRVLREAERRLEESSKDEAAVRRVRSYREEARDRPERRRREALEGLQRWRGELNSLDGPGEEDARRRVDGSRSTQVPRKSAGGATSTWKSTTFDGYDGSTKLRQEIEIHDGYMRVTVRADAKISTERTIYNFPIGAVLPDSVALRNPVAQRWAVDLRTRGPAVEVLQISGDRTVREHRSRVSLIFGTERAALEAAAVLQGR